MNCQAAFAYACVILAGVFIIFQLSTLLATQGLFDLNSGNKLPGRGAVCDLLGCCLVGVLNMDFAACDRTEIIRIVPFAGLRDSFLSAWCRQAD